MKRRTTATVRAALVLLAVCAETGSGGNGPEQLGAHWARVSDRAGVQFLVDGARSVVNGGTADRIMKRNAALQPVLQAAAKTTGTDAIPVSTRTDGSASAAPSLTLVPVAGQRDGFSVGNTFTATPVSREHGIERLSRGVTMEKLSRALFSTPGPSASYYTARYMQIAPYVAATYVQFVVDHSWNRIVYGNMNRWIKSYEDLIGPTSVAVDPAGRIYVGEAGRKQVAVLQLDGEGDDAQLRLVYTIQGITAPTAVAHSDNGTPLNPDDDVLYVADAVRGVVLKFKLGPSGATLAGTFEGFDSPTSLTVGRWNGANNGFLYVIDKVAKRVRVLEDAGTSLSLAGEYRGDDRAYFIGMTTDHFGNVYLADNSNSRLCKLTASLEMLDEEGGTDLYASLSAVDIPFGRITVDGQGTYWAGFDQLFAVERWSNQSGAQRRTLGLRLKDIVFASDADASMITGQFTLTDFGTVGARIYTGSGTLIRTIQSSGMVSGRKAVSWDRRDDGGRLVSPGEYRYELAAASPYRDETITAAARWTLPLYYEERGGIDEPHRVQGTSVHWGNVSAAQDDDAVIYRFTGLNPSGTYSVSAEYVAADGAARVQDLSTGNGLRLHDPIAVDAAGTRIDFVSVPASAYASGELVLSVNRRGSGTAVVTRIVLKETGTGFSSQQEETAIPTHYALAQNFPNPFNPSTVIRYAIPEGGPVSLTVYDITGREVVRLVNDSKPAGSYEVRFDAAMVNSGGLASGVYFYRVHAGKWTETKKMLLIK